MHDLDPCHCKICQSIDISETTFKMATAFFNYSRDNNCEFKQDIIWMTKFNMFWLDLNIIISITACISVQLREIHLRSNDL